MSDDCRRRPNQLHKREGRRDRYGRNESKHTSRNGTRGRNRAMRNGHAGQSTPSASTRISVEYIDHAVKCGQVTLNFHHVARSLLQSMVPNTLGGGGGGVRSWKAQRSLRALRKLDDFHMIAAVFWPTVWDRIWAQFIMDVPRQHIEYDGQQWPQPGGGHNSDASDNGQACHLFNTLETDLGPCWARWLCLFLNQAPMSDVVELVTRAVQQLHRLHSTNSTTTSQVILCEHPTERGMHMQIDYTSRHGLQVIIDKHFRAVQPSDMLVVHDRVSTRYTIGLYPVESAVITWTIT